MDIFSRFLTAAVDVAWGVPLVVLLIGGGLYLCLVSRLLPLRGFWHAIKLTLGIDKVPGDLTAEGQISHFKALTNALAATIGMGNIAGVAVAIQQGGPGAIFWMWVAAFIGMVTKYFECTIAIKYRGKNYKGETQGGPMYTIENALHKRWLFLGFFFAGAGFIASIPLFNANQLARIVQAQYKIPSFYVGCIVAAILFYILSGGIKRLAQTTGTLVPIMCAGYVLLAIVTLVMNVAQVPSVFEAIFMHAFTGDAMWGGAVGSGIVFIMQTGVKRSAFSNESGIGTAPMAHSNVKTSEPVSQGLVAMLGPFIDTILVCTMTALVILSTFGPTRIPDLDGVLLTLEAFKRNFGAAGAHFLAISTILFAFTTIVGGANYAEKCFDFIFRGYIGSGGNFFKVFFCGCLIVSTVITSSDAINIIDICFALMAVPNMIVTLALAPETIAMTKDYFRRYRVSV